MAFAVPLKLQTPNQTITDYQNLASNLMQGEYTWGNTKYKSVELLTMCKNAHDCLV